MLDAVTHDVVHHSGHYGASYDAPPLTLVIGAPRSGTTWLAKIFDSHPNVVYRHEPDLTNVESRLPFTCGNSEVEHYAEEARAHVAELVAAHDLKTVGTLPVFPKAHDRPLGRLARLATILSARAAINVSKSLSPRDIAVPEFHNFVRAPRPHVVIKSIIALGRIGLFSRALPDARIILLIRNPLAQIASRSVGVATGKMRRYRFDTSWLATDQARRFGVSTETVDRCTMVEQMAWEWVLSNQKACEDIADRPNGRIVRYADLVVDPVETARDLFAFAELPWHDTCRDFVHRSVSYKGRSGYFQVFRGGSETLTKWRTTLTATEQTQIAAIVRQAPISGLWGDSLLA